MAVGAGILSIITESLYDKPIVVFREYVQNSADAFARLESYDNNGKNQNDLKSHMWEKNGDLFFLDNGTGIARDAFLEEMKNIGKSSKKRTTSIGYKGIGRLSGFSYCNRLELINIVSYKKKLFQNFTLYKNKYDKEKQSESFNEMTFEKLMSTIGASFEDEQSCNNSWDIINDYITSNDLDMFSSRDSGFLVILREVSKVLMDVINDSDFLSQLGWLLPVKFQDELLKSPDYGNLFNEMTLPENEMNAVPAKAYNIFFNTIPIQRPINTAKLRAFTCKHNYNRYAIGFNSFNVDRIVADKNNDFSGIRVYLDNMLLCDETELIPALQQFGLIEHSAFELIQTVQGVGVMIYIIDKVNIISNARRTFIEVADESAIELLRYIAVFVENIYLARYALSKYYNAKKSIDRDSESLKVLRDRVNDTLAKLTEEVVTVPEEDESFEKLTQVEKRRLVKKTINREIGKHLDSFLAQKTEFNLESAYNDFLTWFKANTK